MKGRSISSRLLGRLRAHNSLGLFLPGNSLTLLNSGQEYFPALINAIENATQNIYLESYIFADDSTGRLVAAALARAAQRGLTVRMVIDGFGGKDFVATLMSPLSKEGVQILIYRPEVAPFSLNRRRLRRMHRKIALIDEHIAFVGGINVDDDIDPQEKTPPRFDFAVRITGPLVLQIRQTVHRLWDILAWANFQYRFRLPKNEPLSNYAPTGQQNAAFIVRDNIRHRHKIEEAYLAAIHAARHDILIANAYFLPGHRFRAALLAAAMRGVNVQILLQGPTEHRLLHYATQSLYSELLAGHVRIFECKKSFLHAKVACIDEQWATVGSSNIDPFSLLLAKEANIVVQDAAFTQHLRQSLQVAMQEGAIEMTAPQWHRRWWGGRFLQWVSYQVTRILIGVAGYGRLH